MGADPGGLTVAISSRPVRLAAVPRVDPVRGAVAAHTATLAAALLLWAGALTRVDLAGMGGRGLLDVLPLGFFAAGALLLGGFVAAVTREPLPTRLLALYVLALIVYLHGTTPLLYDEPRYAYTYKHVGVIDLIAQTGTADRGIDIYNNWPAFFALNAWFSEATGVEPLAYAEWSQVAFNVVNVLVVRFALRGVTSDERLLWGASLFFVLGNWLGQDYLAPQALGFVLTVFVLGLVLRLAPHVRPALTDTGERWRDVLDRLPGEHAGPSVPAASRFIRPRPAIAVAGLALVAVVVAHQLSPLMLIASVTALSLLLRRVPLWVPLVAVALEAAWLALAWPFLQGTYNILSFNPLANAQVQTEQTAEGLPGLGLTEWSARGVVALMLVVAVVGFVRASRAGQRLLPALVLGLAPLPVVLGLSYGGEVGLRAYLFALPWLALLGAAAVIPSRAGARERRRARFVLAPVTALVAAASMSAYFGLELANHVRSEDVAASAWYERNAPAGSVLVQVVPNVPTRLTARYAEMRRAEGAYPANLIDVLAVGDRRLGEGAARTLEGLLASVPARAHFIVLSPVQEQYTRLYGLLPEGSFDRLGQALERSPRFERVFRRGSASVFAWRGRAGRGGRAERTPPSPGLRELWERFPLDVP